MLTNNRYKMVLCLLVLILSCAVLSGCRTRITANGPETGPAADRTAAGGSEHIAEESGPSRDREDTGAPAGRTREDPDAVRKEYDENAQAEIVPGAEKTVHAPGEGNGTFDISEEAVVSAARLEDGAEETALRTVPAEEAERNGISEEARAADSAMTYYTVLLEERIGPLFECQRPNCYWETSEDHVTVYRTSAEHALILKAGCYDVSARLLEENLRVDDGWVVRKDPGIIVKVASGSVLGHAVSNVSAAQSLRASLLARSGWGSVGAVRNGRVLILSEELFSSPHLRLQAVLIIAKTALPDLFGDLDLDLSMRMLSEEAGGPPSAGIYYYNGPAL